MEHLTSKLKKQEKHEKVNKKERGKGRGIVL